MLLLLLRRLPQPTTTTTKSTSKLQLAQSQSRLCILTVAVVIRKRPPRRIAITARTAARTAATIDSGTTVSSAASSVRSRRIVHLQSTDGLFDQIIALEQFLQQFVRIVQHLRIGPGGRMERMMRIMMVLLLLLIGPRLQMLLSMPSTVDQLLFVAGRCRFAPRTARYVIR